MMKKITFFLFAAMLAFAVPSTFVSCGDDDEDTEETPDFRDDVVGTYSNKITFYLYKEDKNMGELSAKNVGDAIISKSGIKSLKIDDIITGEIIEASNGFVFNVPSQEIDNIWWQGFTNYTLEGYKYDGGYIRENGKMSFYMGVSLEQYAETLSEEEQNAFAELLVLLELAEGTSPDQLEDVLEDIEDYKIVFEYEMYHKQ